MPDLLANMPLGGGVDVGEFNMKFAAIRRPRIFAPLGPPDLLFNRGHARNCEHIVRNVGANTAHPLKCMRREGRSRA